MTVEESKMIKQGIVQVYTGNNKGKTTSSVGLAVRALSYGWKILVIQFLKTDCMAYDYLRDHSNNITVKQFGRHKITLSTNVDDEDRRVVDEAWNYLMEESAKGYDMIILDEVLPTFNLGLIAKKDLYNFTRYTKENKIELVMTGRMWSRGIKSRIYDIADLVTNMKPVKHYFNMHCKECKREFEDPSYAHCPLCGEPLKKVPARKGIEF